MTIDKLPWKRIRSAKRIHTFPLPETLYVEQWIVPAGTVVVMKETRNFGWLLIPQGTQDERGFTIPRRLFKW